MFCAFVFAQTLDDSENCFASIFEADFSFKKFLFNKSNSAVIFSNCLLLFDSIFSLLLTSRNKFSSNSPISLFEIFSLVLINSLLLFSSFCKEAISCVNFCSNFCIRPWAVLLLIDFSETTDPISFCNASTLTNKSPLSFVKLATFLSNSFNCF